MKTSLRNPRINDRTILYHVLTCLNYVAQVYFFFKFALLFVLDKCLAIDVS